MKNIDLVKAWFYGCGVASGLLLAAILDVVRSVLR